MSELDNNKVLALESTVVALTERLGEMEERLDSVTKQLNIKVNKCEAVQRTVIVTKGKTDKERNNDAFVDAAYNLGWGQGGFIQSGPHEGERW